MTDHLIQRDVPLARLSTLRVGGVARTLLTPRHSDDLADFLQAADREGRPAAILGRGSNTLIRDGVIETPVILMSHFSRRICVNSDSGEISADAGAPLPEIARRAADAGIAGLEFLAVIPGLLGGGVIMNCGIGGPGGPSAAHTLVSVDSIDFLGHHSRTKTEDLFVRYRSIRLPREGVVTRAVLVGKPGHKPTDLHAEIDRLKAERRLRQPHTRRTSGSVWLPAQGRPAGAIIDESGLRGFSVGRATISRDHANWIEVRRGCTSDEVMGLVESLECRVHAITGVMLEREVCLLPQSPKLLRP